MTMNTPNPDPPSHWQRTTTRRFLKWLFTWRTVRRALISLAVLVTLYTLFCTEENIRGKRAWERYRRELEARGEQLDFGAFIPKPIPDEQNFAATPLIKSWFVRSNYTYHASEYWKGDNYGRVESMSSAALFQHDQGNRHFTDLVAWEMAFDVVRAGKLGPNQRFESDKLDLASRAKPAPAVLDGLKTNEAIFAEIRAASQRPYSRYPVEYDLDNPYAILLPQLTHVKNVCERLELKACAELAAGQSQDALEDVKLSLRMADSLKEEPFIISYLVRVACLQKAIQPVWEGLAEHAWADAQLRDLQSPLLQGKFLKDMPRSLSAERAAAILSIDLVRKKGLGYLFADPHFMLWDRRSLDLVGMVIPRGWYDQEKLNYCRLFEMQFAGGVDVANKRVSPSRLQADSQEFDQQFSQGSVRNFIRHRSMAAMLCPDISGVVRRAAQGQTAADQAMIACALERYRLASGRFPDTLDALVPQFISQLPHDVITSEPYKYRLTKDGQFVLYSVGWNEKDDGGVPGKTLFDEKEGDWVWQ
jgi:hypothetical protein